MNGGYERNLVAAVFCYKTTTTEGEKVSNGKKIP